MKAKTKKHKGPYWLNDVAEFYWEICRGLSVVIHIAKMADDSNRPAAMGVVTRMNNAYHAKRKAKVRR